MNDFKFITAVDTEAKIGYVKIDGTFGKEVDGGLIAHEISYLDKIAKVKEIHIDMNSVGGVVYDSLKVVSAILDCKAETHGYNKGLVMSACFHTFLACDVLHAYDYSIFMYHEAHYSDKVKLSEKAKQSLAVTNEAMSTLIANRLNKDVSEVSEMLKDESYFMAGKFEEKLGMFLDVQTSKRDKKPVIKSSMSLEEIVAEFESFNTNLNTEEMSETKYDISAVMAKMEISADVANPIEAITAKFVSLTSSLEKSNEKVAELEGSLKEYTDKEAESYIASLVEDGLIAETAKESMLAAYKASPETVKATYAAMPKAQVDEVIEDDKLTRETEESKEMKLEVEKDENGEEFTKDYAWYSMNASDELKLMMVEEPAKYQFLLDEYTK